MDQESGVSKQVERQFRIYTTLLEIVEERDYVVVEDKKFTSIKEFQIKMPGLEVQVFFKQQEDEQQKHALGLHCNFYGSKVDENMMMRLSKSFQGNLQTIICVVPPSEKPGALPDKQFQHKVFEQTSTRIQLFRQQQLLFNVLKHDLVPKHVILKDHEKADILAYYKVKQSQLPKILTSDPVARFLGLRKGQVVKIIRKSETAGLYTTYRVAV